VQEVMMSRNRSRPVTNPLPVVAYAAWIALMAGACVMEEATGADLEVEGLQAPVSGGSWGLQTDDGHFVTAINAGGRISDAVHTDAAWIDEWETFTVENHLVGSSAAFAFRTSRGFYLTAEGGGGRTVNAIATNRTSPGPWEKFKWTRVNPGNGRYFYRLATADGRHWLTAKNGGNEVTNALETNRTSAEQWETFEFIRAQ